MLNPSDRRAIQDMLNWYRQTKGQVSTLPPAYNPARLLARPTTAEQRQIYISINGHLATVPIADIDAATTGDRLTFSIANAGIARNGNAMASGAAYAVWDFELWKSSGTTYAYRVTHHSKKIDNTTVATNLTHTGTIPIADIKSADQHVVVNKQTVAGPIEYSRVVFSNVPIPHVPKSLSLAETHFEVRGTPRTRTVAANSIVESLQLDPILRMWHAPVYLITPDVQHGQLGGDGSGAADAGGWEQGSAPRHLLRLAHRGLYEFHYFGLITYAWIHFDFSYIEVAGVKVLTILTLKSSARNMALRFRRWSIRNSTSAGFRVHEQLLPDIVPPNPFVIPGDLSFFEGGTAISPYSVPFNFRTIQPVGENNIANLSIPAQTPETPIDCAIYFANTSDNTVQVNLNVILSANLVLGGRIAEERNYLTGGLDGPIPIIALSESTFARTASEGTSPSNDTFTVDNVGDGTLDYTISDNAAWLSCSPTSGTSTGEEDTITVTYSTAALAVGVHTATITVADPNASNNPQTISVQVTITAGDIPPPD